MWFIMKIVVRVHNIIIILLCWCTAYIQMKEIYDIKADELMDSILPNIMKRHSQLRVPLTTTQILKFSISKQILTTSELKLIQKDDRKLSKERLNLRRCKLDIRTLLETYTGPIRNIHNVDEINIQMRRFDEIQKSHAHSRRLFPNYDNPFEANANFKIRYRVLQLMEQFIYQTKYHLPYAQLLRKKYINHIKYQIGYCFSLLRNLKKQQMVIYSTLVNYNEKFVTLYMHMKLYEKIVNLDVDIKDLIVYITDLNNIREKQDADKKRTTKKKEKL